MVLAELIGAFIIILSIVYIYYKYVIYNFWHKKGVFYIKPIVPIGNILPLVTEKTQVGVFFQDAYQKYKEHRCFGMYAFFKPNLVITDLDLMRTVLTKEFKSFHDRGLYSNETIDPAINRLFLNGQNWLRYRAKMTPTFTAGKMKQMFVIVKQCGEELAKHLEKNAQMRDTVEMRDILTRYASDSIMSAAFGVNTNCIQKPNEYQSTSQEKTTFDSNFFKRILIRFAPQVTDFFSLPFSVQAVTNFYMNLFRDTVEYRKANGIVRPDLMSLLIEHVEKDFDPKGSRFGYLQTKVGLIYLLSKYKFKLHSRTPVPLAFSERSAILAPKSGVYLTIELR